jgi:hypothetical protein
MGKGMADLSRQRMVEFFLLYHSVDLPATLPLKKSKGRGSLSSKGLVA